MDDPGHVILDMYHQNCCQKLHIMVNTRSEIRKDTVIPRTALLSKLYLSLSGMLSELFEVELTKFHDLYRRLSIESYGYLPLSGMVRRLFQVELTKFHDLYRRLSIESYVYLSLSGMVWRLFQVELTKFHDLYRRFLRPKAYKSNFSILCIICLAMTGDP